MKLWSITSLGSKFGIQFEWRENGSSEPIKPQSSRHITTSLSPFLGEYAKVRTLNNQWFVVSTLNPPTNFKHTNQIRSTPVWISIVFIQPPPGQFLGTATSSWWLATSPGASGTPLSLLLIKISPLTPPEILAVGRMRVASNKRNPGTGGFQL